jgi:hypothetical protein
MILTRPWNSTDVKAWIRLGPARGTVSIPAGVAVKLVVVQEQVRDLSPIARLSPDAIQSIILVGNDLTDDAMSCIAGLTGLRQIEVTSTNVSDAGIAGLKGLRALQELSLYGVKLTDDGLAMLESFPHLETLNIGQCGISNAGLVHIKKLATLRRLSISGTKVSPEGLTVLKYDMPQCRIGP